MSRITIILALALLSASAIFGQAVAIGSVSGTISDQSGSYVPGATVRMIETDKGTVHSGNSTAEGRYTFNNLPTGPYRLEVQANGFKNYSQTGIILQVAENLTQNVALQVGALSETVEVQAGASMVETRDSSISQVIEQQRIVDLPLNGRNLTSLLMISGVATGTMTLNGGDLTGSKNMGGSNGSGQFSVAGGAANGLNYLLDGGDNNDSFSNVNMPIPFPDAVQEFSVQTNGLPAQYGLHPGGVVNIVTKSGANSLHGDLFEFLRNGDLNARQNSTPVRDTLKRSQFGGVAGGRILKDKLFFFGGYQGTRQRSDPASQIAYTPTAATLAGDFSVVDGGKANGGCLASPRALKDASGVLYPNNQIPKSTFDSAGFKLASAYIPVSADPCGKTFFGYLANNPDDQAIGRIDYNVSSKQQFYGRYFIYAYKALSLFDGQNALTTGTPGNDQRSQTMTIGDTYTLSPTMVNSFHATFDRRRNNRASAGNLFSPTDLGVNMFINYPHYTQLSVSSYSGGGFNVGCGTCAFANFNINTYQLADDFTIMHGRHQIAFGFDGRKDQFNSFNHQQSNGQFTFGGATSGDGLADLLIGRFSGLTDGNVISDYLRQTVMAAYVQDAFKPTSHLTINFGVRWEPSVPAYDKYGRGNQFSYPLFLQNWHSSVYPTAPAGLIFTGDSENHYGKALTASHWATFSPRLGMVWDPNGDGKQTIRASFGLMHDTTELFYPERWTTNAPYVSSLTLTSGQFSDPFKTYVLNGKTGDPFPGAAVFPVGGAYISVPGNLKVTYMMQWNLSYQRQLAKDWMVTANYLGNASRHIWGSTDINYSIPTAGATTGNTNARRLTSLLNPTTGQYYGNIQQSDDGANASYHGLLMKAERRMSHGLALHTTYTYSHCISSWDFAGELAGQLYQNPLNRASGERGNCGYDHRHSFTTSLVALSSGFGGGAARFISKDWQISPIISLFTGNPIQITDGKDISLSGQGLDRPNVILPDQVYGAPKTVLQYLNPAAFQCAGSNAACTVFSGQFGNLGRNSLYGPGQRNFDIAVSRIFRFHERFKTEFRSDFFNILNHANWNNPVSSLSSAATFGQITSFGSPRIIQMALKLYF
jgi:Carboxypeptidase regulatory-like domain